MLTVRDIEQQREQIQEDLLCILDGIDQQILDDVCEVVVDRLDILRDKLTSEGRS